MNKLIYGYLLPLVSVFCVSEANGRDGFSPGPWETDPTQQTANPAADHHPQTDQLSPGESQAESEE